jgi:hypothetical protein
MTMKLWISSMALVVMVSASSVLADQPTTASLAPVASANAAAEKHPCRKLQKEAVEACKAAGFAVGKHKEGKGLFEDCVKPLHHGKTIEGVTFNQSLVKECQAKKEERKEAKAATATETAEKK